MRANTSRRFRKLTRERRKNYRYMTPYIRLRLSCAIRVLHLALSYEIRWARSIDASLVWTLRAHARKMAAKLN